MNKLLRLGVFLTVMMTLALTPGCSDDEDGTGTGGSTQSGDGGSSPSGATTGGGSSSSSSSTDGSTTTTTSGGMMCSPIGGPCSTEADCCTSDGYGCYYCIDGVCDADDDDCE